MKGICIGMGRRGRARVQWAGQAEMEVVGMVDINRAVLDVACEELGVPASMRYERIADAVRATGVVEEETQRVPCQDPLQDLEAEAWKVLLDNHPAVHQARGFRIYCCTS